MQANLSNMTKAELIAFGKMNKIELKPSMLKQTMLDLLSGVKPTPEVKATRGSRGEY